MIYSEFQELFAAPLRNGVSYPSATRGNGVPMVNMGEAFKFDIITNQECERVPLTEAEQQRYLLQEGDLLFVRQSLKYEGAGRCVYVAAAAEQRTWESHLMRVRLDSTRAQPRYYYYYFRSVLGRQSIEPIIHQVAAAGIRGSDLSRIQVPVPPLRTQNAIVAVLAALDEKIAANDRIAGTAYELAAAEYTRCEKEAARMCALGDVVELAYGKALPMTQRRPGPVAVFGSGGSSGWHAEPLVRGPGIIVGRKGTVGSVRWSHHDFFPIDTTFYIKVTDSTLTIEYVYFLLKRLGLDEMNSDSAVPGLNRSRALAVPIRLPDPNVIAEFTKRVQPLFELREQMARENGTLSTLRDYLLPHLMSGRLRVRDAEKVVEEAV